MAEEGFPMNTGNDPDLSLRPRFRFPSDQKIGVHVLSEYVFCPRAAVIASESNGDGGDEEPNLGPRLDLVIDYHEHTFVEALKLAWGETRLWVTLLAAGVFIVMIVGYLTSVATSLVLSLPVFILLARCWETVKQIAALVRAQRQYRNAPDVVIDQHASDIRNLSWWSLRKAGFECSKAPDRFEVPNCRVVGKPWRLLKKGGLMIPVIRRRRGSLQWGAQHEVRLSAYCDLIEKCTGGEAPFGVVLFSGTDSCVVIPNNKIRQETYKEALKHAIRLMAPPNDGPPTSPPSDDRCSGCVNGKPRLFQPGKSDTVLDGKPLSACTANSVYPDGNFRGAFHSICGDRFRWAPPHQDAIALGIARQQ